MHAHIHTRTHAHTQAVRVTNAGKLIRRLGLELRARPYLYAETPMLDLDSFETYCVNTNVQVRGGGGRGGIRGGGGKEEPLLPL